MTKAKKIAQKGLAKILRNRKESHGKLITDEDILKGVEVSDAGTYIKELVHSDEGRTNPSVSGKLGVDCEILWLDVDQIHDDEENKDN